MVSGITQMSSEHIIGADWEWLGLYRRYHTLRSA